MTPFMTGIFALIGLLPGVDGFLFELRGLPGHFLMAIGVVIIVTGRIRPDWHGLDDSMSAAQSQDEA